MPVRCAKRILHKGSKLEFSFFRVLGPAVKPEIVFDFLRYNFYDIRPVAHFLE